MTTDQTSNVSDPTMIIRTEIKEITPQIAQKWLAGSSWRNRAKSKARIKQYAQAMQNGEWKVNGESIKFSVHGLIDGQHRLEACLVAGVPFQTVVMYGVDSESFDTIDTGKARLNKDVLSISGYEHSAEFSATVRWLERYKSKRIDEGASKLSNREMLEVAARYGTLQRSIDEIRKDLPKFMPRAVGIATYHLFREAAGKDWATEFFSSLSKGVGLHERHPIWVLRERLLAEKAKPGRVHYEAILVWTIKAWNAWLQDRQIKTLRYIGNVGEQVPDIVRMEKSDG